jgi:hypothetical protein
MSKLYYTPPLQKLFDEVKNKCMEVWNTYDDTYGYASEKIGRIKDLKNVSDNFMYMVAMFDMDNQKRLAKLLSEEAKKAIAERIKSGGTPDIYNVFL